MITRVRSFLTALCFAPLAYAQSGEDLILRFLFDRLHIQHPSYLDIGAHHPYYLSNTALFYEQGSRGINIEPDPDLFQAFIRHRPQDINLNIGIAQQSGELMFYRMNTSTLNTFSSSEARRLAAEEGIPILATQPVPVSTLAQVLAQYWHGGCPELLSLDVEGMDEVILQSMQPLPVRPVVLCLETLQYRGDGSGQKQQRLIDLVVAMGYQVYADTFVNTIFVQQDYLAAR